MKRGIALILIALLCFGMSGCERFLDVSYWEKLNCVEQRQRTINGNNDYYLTYQGENYYEYEDCGFFIPNSGDDKQAFLDELQLIGWVPNFPYTLSYEFYSYSEESPDFIVHQRPSASILFKESFDYKAETFVIKETNSEIVFAEAFGSEAIEKQPAEIIISWYCKKHPMLDTEIDIFSVDGVYYMYLNIEGGGLYNFGKAYQVSDKLLQILMDNGIIE